jgi:TonB family protein
MAMALVAALAAAAAAAEEPDQTWTQLGCRGKEGVSYYPPVAIQRNQSGAVLLQYSVNAKGRPERIAVLDATASASLQAAAMQLLSDVRCKKPDKAWVESGGPQQRFKLNVLFQFIDEEPATPIDAKAGIVRVSVEKSRGAK